MRQINEKWITAVSTWHLPTKVNDTCILLRISSWAYPLGKEGSWIQTPLARRYNRLSQERVLNFVPRSLLVFFNVSRQSFCVVAQMSLSGNTTDGTLKIELVYSIHHPPPFVCLATCSLAATRFSSWTGSVDHLNSCLDKWLPMSSSDTVCTAIAVTTGKVKRLFLSSSI